MRLGSRWRGLWRDGVALGRRADPSARLLLLAGGVGALGGLVAGVFDFARFHLGRLALGGGEDALAAAPAWWLLLLPTLGGVVAGFLVRWTTQGRGPIGVPRLIHATQLAGERLPLRDGVGTALGALVALVTGHSGGREAPVAGLTASIAEAGLARLGISGAQARVLAAAGAAGAIAASFNTPLGSAILAMELFLGSFALRHFGPVVTATVVGTLVGQALLGERVAFHPPPFVLGSPWELLAYAGLGVACALVARGFTALIGLVDALQLDRPVLVCHDWGGAVGWQTVLTYPDRFRAFVPINMPHLGVMNRELRRWRQLKKSWYIFAFQLPGVAERLLSARDCQKLVGALFANTVHRPFTEDDLIRYREAWTQPGAIRAMVSWYRAIARHGAPRPPQATVELPSRMIWGRHDKALGFPMVEPSMAYLPNGDLHVIEDAGHFVQHDCPDQVNALLLDFLRFLEG